MAQKVLVEVQAFVQNRGFYPILGHIQLVLLLGCSDPLDNCLWLLLLLRTRAPDVLVCAFQPVELADGVGCECTTASVVAQGSQCCIAVSEGSAVAMTQALQLTNQRVNDSLNKIHVEPVEQGPLESGIQ